MNGAAFGAAQPFCDGLVVTEVWGSYFAAMLVESVWQWSDQ